MRLSGFTIDLNNSWSHTLQNVLQFQAYEGNADGLQIDHIAIVDGNTLSLQIGVAAAGGFTYSHVSIDSNHLEMALGPSQNQCIALSTVNGSGKIPFAIISRNTCEGSGIQSDGDGTLITGNDVSGYQFGTGIFTAFVTKTVINNAGWKDGVATLHYDKTADSFSPGEIIHVWGARPRGYNGSFQVLHASDGNVSYALQSDPGRYSGGALAAPDPSNRDCTIRNNILHDTRQTLDVNHTAPGGIENNCVKSRIENNRAINLGGAGFINYASGSHYVGNRAIGVGYGGRNSAGGEGDGAGFVISDNGSGMPWYRSLGLVFNSNSSEPRGGRPRYGYFEEPWHLFNAKLHANTFSGAERSVVVRTRPMSGGFDAASNTAAGQ